MVAMNSLEQVQLIFDTMPSMAWMKDQDGVYLVINKRFEEFGIKKGINIVGKTDFGIFPEHLAHQFREIEETVMQSKQPQSADWLYESETGNLWHDTYIAPVVGEDGKVNGTIGFARRISRRKQLELELNRQKEFLKTMIDTIPDFIFYKDINSVLLGCNKACLERLYGVTEEEAIGKKISSIVKDHDFATSCLQHDREVLATGNMVKHEEKMALVDRSILEFETVKTPFFDSEGKVAGLIGVSRDITTRKRMERQLKESQERYAAIVNNAPEIVIIHRNGIIRFINDVGVKAIGYDRDAIVGSHINCYLTKASSVCVAEAMSNICKGEAAEAHDIEFINKSGEVKNGIVKAARISLGGEQANLMVLIDVTEKKRIEAKLWESEERFRQVAQNINEVLMIRDDEKILYVSPAYERISGHSLQSILDNPLLMFEIVHPDDRDRMQTAFIQGGQQMDESSNAEFRFFRSDGAIRWIWMQSYPIAVSVGTGKQKAITLVDITDRKHMEEQLRQRDEQNQREFTLAARVQQDALPDPYSGAKVRVSPIFLPYHTVSGDLINYRWFKQQNKLRGYIVDVSGHGMATALQTATVKMLLDQRLLGEKTINEDDFQHINQRMMQYLYEESFAGLMYFEFDFSSFMLTVITGGIHFFLEDKPGECNLVPVFSGYLGMFDKAEVQTMTKPFKPGEIYCMMSDGASDLIEMFGVSKQNRFSRYLEWFDQLAQRPERSDDFSVVCIEIIEKNTEIRICDIQKPDETEKAQELIATFLERNAPNGAGLLEVAVNEAVNNGLRAGGRVDVKMKRTGSRIIARIKDTGPGFSVKRMSALLDKDIENELDQLGLSEGGRGIMMMKMFCDQVLYNTKGNEVLLIKKIF
ncbi:PAS domain S-box protein [Sporomusa malonica]|uniref:PAS domain S-box-containing protein n=1 Tax=Sporomusa malonica TaxID=112901 RepID=A0A1W2ER72_9FIRM|nr:PAS domain S-box protein [Sporomusa malonica]SMD12220.1 PAS domain S-box-containing protein [Sporomusa malonica]